MSEATDIERIALAEVRLLREAQRGNAEAVNGLLEPHLPGLWSICRAVLGSDELAVSALQSFRQLLPRALRSFTADRAFGLQLYEHLWHHLATRLEPSPRLRIVPPVADAPRTLVSEDGGSRDTVMKVLASVDPRSRLVWVFSTVTGLPAAGLARLTGVPEQDVRDARSAVSFRMHEAMTQ